MEKGKKKTPIMLANIILKENKIGGLTLLTSRLTIKLKYSRQCGVGERRDK